MQPIAAKDVLVTYTYDTEIDEMRVHLHCPMARFDMHLVFDRAEEEEWEDFCKDTHKQTMKAINHSLPGIRLLVR